MDDFFSENYVEARERFLVAARRAGAELAAYGCPAAGADGGALYTDTARLGPMGASRVLVLMSGVHGIEGFAGSAIQTAFLAGGGAKNLPDDVALLLVHSLNPFGFAHLRRVNEDNIDLNRNFVDFDNKLPANSEYDRLADIIAPHHIGGWYDVVLRFRIAGYQFCHGQEALQGVVTRGQYRHPAGLFFGGKRPASSNRVLREILSKHLCGASEVALIDLHTGLGPRGHGELIVSEPPDSDAYRNARCWWGDRVRSTTAGESVSAHLSGTVRVAFAEAAPQAALTAAGLEFGTQPAMQVFRALRAENWLHHHGGPRHPDAARIQQEFRDAFAPDDPVWQRAVVMQGVAAPRPVLDLWR